MAKKIEVTDLAQAYTPPADANIATLRELAADAQEQALKLLENDNYTDDDLARANWLAAAIDACNAAAESIEATETERRAKADELRSKIKPTEPATDDDTPNGGNGGEPAAPAAVEEAVEAVVAASVPSIADVARVAGPPAVNTSRGRASLVAAADVPGFAAGSELTHTQLGEAFLARSRSFEGLAGSNGTYSANVARLRIQAADEGLVASGRAGGGDVDITEALDHACDETRLATSKGAGSLVAAGGWCAPSEPLYDLLNLMTAEGLISVPEITVTRGGIKWATGPDFTAVYQAGGLFTQTEAQNMTGATKPRVDIPCPPMQEARMNADGLYLTSNILSQRGWPEATADFITKSQIAFQHYVAAKTIADMVTGSTPVDLSQFGGTPTPPAYGALATVLGAVSLQVEDMKYRGRLSRGQSVEVVLPYFARGIFRADLMKRQVTDPTEIVLADAQIDALFTALGVNPQFVYDWQDAVTDTVNSTGFGGATAVTSWPQAFKVLVYPSGTWARAIEPIINLDAVYDSTLLSTNQYVALFTEQGRLTIKRGFDSRIIKVASNPNGATGGTVPVSGSTATQV